jgi:hypothetical protein
MKKRVSIFFMALALNVYLFGAVLAFDTPVGSLAGIKEFRVFIEKMNPAVNQMGLNERDIWADVELKMKMAGIGISEKAEPYLQVKVVAVPTSYTPHLYAITIIVSVKQMVMLSRSPKIKIYAETWSVETTGILGSQQTDKLRNWVGDDVDNFIQAYLSVNPKK